MITLCLVAMPIGAQSLYVGSYSAHLQVESDTHISMRRDDGGHGGKHEAIFASLQWQHRQAAVSF